MRARAQIRRKSYAKIKLWVYMGKLKMAIGPLLRQLRQKKFF